MRKVLVLLICGFAQTSWAQSMDMFTQDLVLQPEVEKTTPPPPHADVQKSECIGNPKDPVKAIYLHGWFPFKGHGGNPLKPNFYLDLETANRAKLEKLASEMHIRIAVPLAGGKNIANKKRTWNPEDTDGVVDPSLVKYLRLTKMQKAMLQKTGRVVFTKAQKRQMAMKKLAMVERRSEKACGSPLARHRALIGFSDGGYLARDIALSCDQHLKDNYDLVVMSGANEPREFRFAQKALPVAQNRFQNCPKFVAMAGALDPLLCHGKHEDPLTHQMLCESFESVHRMSERMREYYANGGGTTDARGFEGSHMIPPMSILSEEIRNVAQPEVNDTAVIDVKANK